MRRLSLRSLLFLLALVMQTATGGMTFAGTYAGVPGVSADCALTRLGDHQTAPAHGGHHGQHDCVSCQLCAAAAAALAVVTSYYRVAFDHAAPFDLDLEFNRAPAALSQRTQQPRAPPVS
ncbi:MAG: DUF2946 family protein [Methylocystis sp.]